MSPQKKDLKASICAAKDCERLGVHYLKVIYLNRGGWFCDSCKDKLVRDRLVELTQGGQFSMSDEVTSTIIETPWRQSAKGSIYCMWGNLPDDLKSQLQQQDKFGITIGEFHYNIKQNQDGGFVVFRNTKTEYDMNRQQFFSKNNLRTVEIKVIQIEQANKLLNTAEGYELVGNDPIKVVDGEFFAIIGKKVKK